MLKRVALVAALAAALLLATASLAFGWSNGPHNGGFGTHDWIIMHAVQLAGNGAKWLDVDEACLSSEDPDILGTSSYLHTYRPSGLSQGAPQECANLYYKCVAAHQAGDDKQASYYFGLMTHYYADICQPMHTNEFTEKQAGMHLRYEQAVDKLTRHAGDSPNWWVSRDETKTVSDVRKKTLKAALYSRTKAKTLKSELAKSGDVTRATTSKITQECLSRAANDIGDIISSVPSATGLSARPATMTKHISSHSVKLGRGLAMYVRCLDASGAPICAARVVFKWPTKNGTTSVVRYTASDGRIADYHYVSGLRAGKTAKVRAINTSSGKSKTATISFKPHH